MLHGYRQAVLDCIEIMDGLYNTYGDHQVVEVVYASFCQQARKLYKQED